MSMRELKQMAAIVSLLVLAASAVLPFVFDPAIAARAGTAFHPLVWLGLIVGWGAVGAGLRASARRLHASRHLVFAR